MSNLKDMLESLEKADKEKKEVSKDLYKVLFMKLDLIQKEISEMKKKLDDYEGNFKLIITSLEELSNKLNNLNNTSNNKKEGGYNKKYYNYGGQYKKYNRYQNQKGKKYNKRQYDVKIEPEYDSYYEDYK